MIKGGVETIVGGLNDAIFGPIVMFGIGGIFVETLKDVSFRVSPIDDNDADEMIREIKGYPILEGSRGLERSDISALNKVIRNVSKIMIENPKISQLDLNPVAVFNKGVSVLDARMILK